MTKRNTGSILAALALSAVSMIWAGPVVSQAKSPVSAPAKAAKSKPSPVSGLGNPGAPGNLQGTSVPKAEAAQADNAAPALKPALADAFIVQNVMRVFLNRPASLFVFNSRGQQVFHLDSRLAMETVPLRGITTGFVYLTVRTAQGETTKKLVYTGK